MLDDNLPMLRLLSSSARLHHDSPGVLAFDLDLAPVTRMPEDIEVAGAGR